MKLYDVYAWIMDEIVYRFFVLVSPKFRKSMQEHMDGVRTQDIYLYGYVRPEHMPKWLKP